MSKPVIDNNHDIAILGGTFDPIHLGHTESAKHIATWLNLSNIILLPAHIPPHKSMPSTSTEHRVNMVKLVCQQGTLFTIDTREILRNSPSYTLETLAEFRQENPHSRLFFIIGMDSLLSFTQWHKWQEILSLCHIVVCTRPGYPEHQFTEPTRSLLAQYQATPAEITNKPCGNILLSPVHYTDVSSTELRDKIQTGQTDKVPMLAPEVLSYINKHYLYKKSK